MKANQSILLEQCFSTDGSGPTFESLSLNLGFLQPETYSVFHESEQA